MRSALQAAVVAFKDLEGFLDSIGPVNRALTELEDPRITGYLRIRRGYDYAAFVVTLYSIFERFVEDLAWSSIQAHAARRKYADLDEDFRRRHVQVSAELLSKVQREERRYADVTPEAVIKSLHDCLSGKGRYQLIRHVVVHHERNFKADAVQGIFGAVGIRSVNDLARKAEPLRQWYREVKDKPDPLDGIPIKHIEEHLRDLVDRRNEITHGGALPDAWLGMDDMRELLAFVQAYCDALHETAVKAYLQQTYLPPTAKSVPLGRITEGPFSNGAIVVERPACRVREGHPIFSTRQGRVEQWGRVKEIRINNKRVRNVPALGESGSLGLLLDFRVTKGMELHLVQRKDEIAWL
ncbi:MAG: MAE_28990/MAE_18760 family HEPN-like nuclease [Polyangiaceae bacterium]